MNFFELCNLRNLVADKTCFKSIMNPKCIDLFLTTCNNSFMHTKTGVSDFHKMILTVLKTTFKKSPPKVKLYRSFKTFDDYKYDNKKAKTALKLKIFVVWGIFSWSFKCTCTLFRQCALLPFFRRKILMNAFITSQFNYCPLVWMCHSGEINNRINNIHYRALRIVYGDNTSSFEDLLRKDGSVTIQQENLRFLALEMFKVIHGATPSFMSDIFTKKSIWIQKIFPVIPDRILHFIIIFILKQVIMGWIPLDTLDLRFMT